MRGKWSFFYDPTPLSYAWIVVGRSREAILRCYPKLHGVSYLKNTKIDYALLTAVVEMALEDSHLPPSNWRGYSYISGCCCHFGSAGWCRAITSHERMIGEPPVASYWVNAWRPFTWRGRIKIMVAPGKLWVESPPSAIDHVLWQYARAYILTLIGSVLLFYKTRARVHLFLLVLLRDIEELGTFSWGNTALAWMYHELCRLTTSTSN